MVLCSLDGMKFKEPKSCVTCKSKSTQVWKIWRLHWLSQSLSVFFFFSNEPVLIFPFRQLALSTSSFNCRRNRTLPSGCFLKTTVVIIRQATIWNNMLMESILINTSVKEKKLTTCTTSVPRHRC